MHEPPYLHERVPPPGVEPGSTAYAAVTQGELTEVVIQTPKAMPLDGSTLRHMVVPTGANRAAAERSLATQGEAG
jgi:hypothetical protein